MVQLNMVLSDMKECFFDGLKGQQSIWGSYIFPWEESHEGSTLKVNGYSAGMRHYFSQKKE